MIENKSCPRCSSLFPAEQVDGEFSGMCPRCLAGLLEPESPLQPGATFGGFEILDVLGQGGMGVVYKARQISLNRIVALKVLAPQTSGSKEFALRFDREAKVLASLNHPNVVQVHDFGREADVPYLVMEYVDGETLESAFKRLDRPRLMEVIRDVVRGLRKVHEAGLIHRDLKPANIFLSRDGAAKIGDFGLAVRTEADCHVTEHGYFVGTPHYASPEHAQGSAIDARSDLYALGAIIYEGFAGRPPFQAAAPAMVLAKHVEEPAPALDGPKDVAALVRRLLEKDPAKRFASAAELEAALAHVSLAPAKRRSWAPAAAALLVAVAALFLFRPAPAGLPFLLAADQAIHDDDFDAAATAVERARRDPAWSAQAGALHQRITALSAAKQEEDLGHYYCFSKGEWEKGLPLIAAGEDSPYREAARKDLAGQNPADAWLELAKSAKPRWAERMRERAWAWLDAAGSPLAAELDRTLEARREIDLLRLSPQLSQGRLRATELQSLPYLPPAAYDLEIEAEGELLIWLPGAGGRRVSGSTKLRVRDGRASAGTPGDLRVAEPRLFHVRGTLTKLTLRAVLPAPRKDDDNLIRRVDPKRDAVVGTWTIEAGALVSPMGEYVRLQLPVELPDEYDVELDLERRQGAALSLGLVSGNRPFMVTLDSHGGTCSGIDHVDGLRANENETTWKGKVLQDFKPSRVRVEVRRTSVKVVVDHLIILHWKGNRERLSNTAAWAVPNPRSPWVSAWQSVFRFSRITVTPATGDVDLLSLIDPARDAYRGTWTSKDGALRSPLPSGVDDLLQIPYAPPAEYELRAIVERRDGGDGFGIGLVGGGRQFMLALDSHGGQFSGLSLVDGREAGENETTWRGSLFKPRVPVALRVAVRKDRLTVTADENTIIDWKADYARCSLRGPWRIPSPEALSLCGLRSGWIVRELRVTAGGRSVDHPSRREEGVVDLLPSIDPARDEVVGRFSKVGDQLRTPAKQAWARLQVPYAPPAEYDLRVVVERFGGTNSLNLGLPWGGRTASITIDGAGPEQSGVAAIDFIDGREFFRNETTRKGPFLTPGSRHLVEASVRAGSVALSIDGRRLFEWKGTPERLAVADGWKIPDPRAIMIGSYDAWFDISEMSVIPKSGPGRRLAAAPAGVDLLAALDVARGTIEGAWKMESGQLVSAPGFSSIAIPGVLQDEYDLELNVERKLKDDAVVIALPVAGGRVALTLDSFGTSSGLDSIDGRGMGATERKGRVLTTDHDHALKISVRRDGVRAEVSGRVIVDWRGDVSRLSMPGHLKLGNGLALATWTSTRFSRLTLRPVSGYQDLLSLIDPRRDAVKGGWALRDGRLVSDNAERAVLEIPYAPSGDYDFRVVFSRKGVSDVNQILTRNGTPFAWCMGGMANVWSGFGSIKEVWAPEPGNPSRVKLGLDENRLYESLVEVRAGGVRAFLDGKLVCEWKTDYRDLSLQPAWSVRDPRRLGLGTFHSPTTFHAIEVRDVKSQAVDLLPLVNPRRDAVKGEWTRNADGSLVSPRTPEARIHLPYEVPAEYDLQITAERRSEDERSFHIGLPVGGRNVLVTLDGFGADRCALENVDGRPSEGAGLDFRGGVFAKAGVPVTVTCRVRRDGLRVDAGGRTVLEWKEDARRLSVPNAWQGIHPKAPLLGTFKSEFRVLAARLLPVGESSVDLLALTDPARDAVAGRWARSGQGLENLTSDAFPRVLFPVKAPAEYDLTMDVERKEGFRSLIVGLVSGESHFVAHIDGWTGTISGLDLLDNKGADQNETTTRDVSYLPLDKKARVVASVRRTGVKVSVDGRVIIDWKGDARRLSMNTRNRPMPRPGLSVGAWDSRFVIHTAGLVEMK